MSNKGKILAVDDTPANLEVIGEILSNAGYTVVEAINGERALKRLQSYQPDLILLDIQMPGIDGFETCRQIKANPETSEIPIIFITAFADVENKVKGFSLGGVDYITKPFQKQEVLLRVDTHLQLGRLNQNLEQQVSERTIELEAALREMSEFQLQLVQSEKMAALGNLMAGVAHEVNNPLGFLKGSFDNAEEYVADLLDYIALYRKHHPNAATPVQDKAEDIELDILCEDLPKLLNSMMIAVNRIEGISNSLRTFSRADTDYKVSADLLECIDSTLLILKYRLKANSYRPEIEVIRNYDRLSLVKCFPGQLNQVFMNILANAIDMFDEMAQGKSFRQLEANPQQIKICTSMADNQVQIYIQDNGKGMTKELKTKIFDYLFTTKSVGKGTGLGLAIARQIIVDKHGGAIEVNSEPGQGTEFIIQLPLEVSS